VGQTFNNYHSQVYSDVVLRYDDKCKSHKGQQMFETVYRGYSIYNYEGKFIVTDEVICYNENKELTTIEQAYEFIEQLNEIN